jgi:hypothetical protein
VADRAAPRRHPWPVPLGREPRGNVPFLIFKAREDALLAAAILPAVGRGPLYRIRPEALPYGFEIESEGEVVGSILLFNEEVAAALHVAAGLLRSPLALARLLEAASGLTLHHAGKILYGELGMGGEG